MGRGRGGGGGGERKKKLKHLELVKFILFKHSYEKPQKLRFKCPLLD